MIKSIFFDIDGTLTSFKTHKIPESTKRALNLLREKGVKLFIATGRSPFILPEIKSALDFEFDGYVMLNGQYCVVEDKVLRNAPLPVKSFKSILPYMEKNNIACEFIEIDYTFTNFINDKLLEFKKFFGGTAVCFPVEDCSRTSNGKVYQMCAFVNENEEKEYFENMPGCRGVRWNDYFVDVIPEDGGKAVGIKTILDHFGFSQGETMAFGDGGNDIEMLEYVKYGIAMGNAGEKVKKSAVYVTDDVDCDGIFNALVHYGIL